MGRHWVMCLGLMAVACDGGAAAGEDGGARGSDAGADGGAIEVCARDRDCGDGALFCAGRARCAPGEPGADARGCVTILPPCEAGTCDEENDRCGVCPIPDRDRDGEPARACGGLDCDDDDPRRSPRHAEVCDPLHLDEDCDPATIHDERSPGARGDYDGDRHRDANCANVVGGEETARGDDCDDTDSTVHPDAPERCNGVDDNCEGRLDETFQCVQSQTAGGLNACGHDATRRCGETCEWLDPGFYRAESAATCDYCDDSGAGLGEEVPFATHSHESRVAQGWSSLGDASVLHYVGPNGELLERWTLTSGPNQRGAVYVPEPLRMGYGPTYVTAHVATKANNDARCWDSRCYSWDPLHGSWSLVVLPEAAGALLGQGELAHPDAAGVAITWHFSGPLVCGGLCPSTAPDRVGLYALGSVSRLVDHGEVTVGRQDGPMGMRVLQDMRLGLTPDDPRTPIDETRIEVQTPLGVGVECANHGNANACGITVTPGSRWRIGLLAASNEHNDVEVAAPSVSASLYDVCQE